MSDPNFTPPQPGDPGTPRDVNREEDIVWDGNDPEKYAGQSAEKDDGERRPVKKTAAKKATSGKTDSQ